MTTEYICLGIADKKAVDEKLNQLANLESILDEYDYQVRIGNDDYYDASHYSKVEKDAEKLRNEINAIYSANEYTE